MICRFAAFELDEQARELRLEGRVIFLQPRVFDLLLYLVNNRERVVSKDELLEAVWPGVVVTESSLQRAASLLRSMLRKGGCADAVRTFSRQGYRFCAEISIEQGPAQGAGHSSELERVRQEFGRGDWEQVVAGFERLDKQEGGLEAADLERWAYAVQCLGRLPQAVSPLERAVAGHLAAGDRRGAVRVALALTHVQFELRELAVAKGWHQRAGSLITDQDETHERGLLEVSASRFAIAEGEFHQAAHHGETAVAIGRSISDADVEALGLVHWGHALLAQGKVQGGTPLLDEAAAAVMTGQVSPLVGGVIYCGVVWGYRNLADWQRASQWVDHFTRWCEQSGLSTYSGSCSLHRAEVLSLRGELAEAQEAIQEACGLLPENSARVEGEAYRILGDLHLARGDLEGAETAFRRAHELGFDPQPGYALLQLARGNPDAAIRGLERALADQNWSVRQRRGLLYAHLATISAGAGRPELARRALEELESESNIWSTPGLAALRARARGEVAFAEAQLQEAIASLRRAVAIWQDIGSPLNVADTRLRLAELFIVDKDALAAELEVSAAETAYQKFDQIPLHLQRCEKLRNALAELS
ncbi:MAG: winged helix-turn-helix domain-containing protein [Gammaproteobacteria bacterium]|jgi:DNA-binding winged helix-turn-helix (wHTH) protein